MSNLEIYTDDDSKGIDYKVSNGEHIFYVNGNEILRIRVDRIKIYANTTPSSPELGDIYVNSSDNKIYFNNGTSWIDLTASGSGGASALNDLTDVTISSPADNEVLAYDSASSEWINQTASEAGIAAESHTHVEADITDLDHDAVKLQGRNIGTTAPNNGQALAWNGTTSEWEPQTISGSSLWTDAGTYIYANNATSVVVTDDGKLGVGNTGPSTIIDALVEDATNNDVTTVLTLRHTTTGTAANGIGTGIDLVVERAAGYQVAIASIRALGTDIEGSSYGGDLAFFTRATGDASPGTEKMRITKDGKIGISESSPTAMLDINGSVGYNQLRLRSSYTPSGSSDTNGNVGDIAWDDNYLYIKTSTGWKRAALSTF